MRKILLILLGLLLSLPLVHADGAMTGDVRIVSVSGGYDITGAVEAGLGTLTITWQHAKRTESPYTLHSYDAGDGTFIYHARKAFKNFRKGKNGYVLSGTRADGTTVTLLVEISSSGRIGYSRYVWRRVDTSGSALLQGLRGSLSGGDTTSVRKTAASLSGTCVGYFAAEESNGCDTWLSVRVTKGVILALVRTGDGDYGVDTVRADGSGLLVEERYVDMDRYRAAHGDETGDVGDALRKDFRRVRGG